MWAKSLCRFCRSRLPGRLCVGQTQRWRLLVDAPADNVRGSIPHSRAEPGGQDTWPGRLQRKAFESDSGQRKLFLPNIFCSMMCPSTCRDGFAEPGLRAGARRMVRPAVASADHATSRAGPCVWHVRLGRNAKAVQPSLGRPSLHHPDSGMANVKTVNAHLHRRPM